MDFRQSEPFSKYLGSSGWKTDRLSDGTYVYIFKLPFLGSILRIPRPKANIPLHELDQIAKKHQAILIKLEPQALTGDTEFESKINSQGYKFDSWSIEPTTTLIIDLAKSEQQLFINLHKRAKSNLKIAQKQDIKIIHSENIDKFNSVWKKNASNKHLLIEPSSKTTMLWQQFKKRKSADLFFAKVKKKIVAAIFLIHWGKTTHLWHIAYTGEYSKLQPLYLLIWEAILFAKKRGSKYFDFEGIEDPRLPYTKWVQPSYFKKGFGGRQVQMAFSYVKYLKSFHSLPFYLLGKIKPNFFRAFYKRIYG